MLNKQCSPYNWTFATAAINVEGANIHSHVDHALGDRLFSVAAHYSATVHIPLESDCKKIN